MSVARFPSPNPPAEATAPPAPKTKFGGATVAERLRNLDCDPIAGMATLAMDENLPDVLRARMYAELATYIAPRRRAFELTGPNGGKIDVARPQPDVSRLSAEECQTLKNLLDKMRGDGGRVS
jgi:hypothetical protein